MFVASLTFFEIHHKVKALEVVITVGNNPFDIGKSYITGCDRHFSAGV